MSRSELLEHAGYFSDRAKLDAYDKALSQLIDPGDVVVDLGSGTGLLGLLAARAGAGRVYMIDSGPILGVATELAEQNGFGDRVIPIRAHSSDVVLPELADLVVCDQVGGLAYDAGILGFFADARRRMLKPGGHLVPNGFTLFLAPVCAPEARERVDLWKRHPHGFDTAVLHRLALNTEWRVDPTGIETLTPGAAVARVSSWTLDRIRHTETFEFDQKSTVDGLLGWFDAELAPGVRLTNAPGLPTRMHRWCNFYPSARRLEVEPGDTLTTTLDIRPEPGLMNWAVTWTRGVDVRGRWRQSTLLGQFLGPEDLLGAASGTRLHPTAAASALGALLQRLDGLRSTDAVIDEVLAEHPHAFPTASRGRSVLTRELGKWARAGR